MLATSLIGLCAGVMVLQLRITRNRKGTKTASHASAAPGERSRTTKDQEDGKSPADDAYARWQDRTRSGLEFENNPLIGLSGGLLVVTLGMTRYTLGWQRLVLGIGFIVPDPPR